MTSDFGVTAGHVEYSNRRFDFDTRHMVMIEVYRHSAALDRFDYERPVYDRNDSYRARLFLTDEEYKAVRRMELNGIYGTDVLGLIQNDPRYASIIHDNGDLHNMPQKHLEHKLLTASANVDGKKVNMVEDNGSINAEAPLTVVNTSGFDLPQTGDHGTWMFTVGGIVLMASAMVMIFIVCRKKSDR